jgi:hypothetical protein
MCHTCRKNALLVLIVIMFSEGFLDFNNASRRSLWLRVRTHDPRIVGSNSTQGIDDFDYPVFLLFFVSSSLATG